jgi:hypothetical protein
MYAVLVFENFGAANGIARDDGGVGRMGVENENRREGAQTN